MLTLQKKGAFITGGSRGNVHGASRDTELNPADSNFAVLLRKIKALPHYGTADEIAALVAYLAGPEEVVFSRAQFDD